jgi:hypothetical protein
MGKLIEIKTGDRYGRLTIIKQIESQIQSEFRSQIWDQIRSQASDKIDST